MARTCLFTVPTEHVFLGRGSYVMGSVRSYGFGCQSERNFLKHNNYKDFWHLVCLQVISLLSIHHYLIICIKVNHTKINIGVALFGL